MQQLAKNYLCKNTECLKKISNFYILFRQNLFSTFSIESIKETTLGANQWLNENNPLKWQSETNNILQDEEENMQPIEVYEDIINVFLKPMEIRTFILKVKERYL